MGFVLVVSAPRKLSIPLNLLKLPSDNDGKEKEKKRANYENTDKQDKEKKPHKSSKNKKARRDSKLEKSEKTKTPATSGSVVLPEDVSKDNKDKTPFPDLKLENTDRALTVEDIKPRAKSIITDELEMNEKGNKKEAKDKNDKKDKTGIPGLRLGNTEKVVTVESIKPRTKSIISDELETNDKGNKKKEKKEKKDRQRIMS